VFKQSRQHNKRNEDRSQHMSSSHNLCQKKDNRFVGGVNYKISKQSTCNAIGSL